MRGPRWNTIPPRSSTPAARKVDQLNRPKWITLIPAPKPIALIRKLYDVEREATKAEMSALQRLELRQERDPPVLKALGTWIHDIMAKEPPKSALYKAAQYTFKQWAALNRFLEDGRLCIDNTGCERTMRVIALGRNNYLFAGSEAGAKAAATIYTIVGTCRLNDVDPWTYLQDVLSKLASGWPNRRVTELLPDIWAQKHAQQANAN